MNAEVHFRYAIFLLFCLFVVTAKAQDDAQLMIKGQISVFLKAKGLGLNVGTVKANNFKEEPLEGVTIEVKKNGASVLKITSGKKGRYFLQIPISTTDAKNDYVVYFSKDGMSPRMIYLNAYLSKDEFKKYQSAKYDFALDQGLYETTLKDIELDKPNGKIKWDAVKDHKFSFDENYARLQAGEEAKIKANADAYFTALAKKKKKTDDALAKKQSAADAKKKAEEELKRKADEEAKALAAQKAKEESDRLAALKAKEEADRIQREKEAMAKADALKKHRADSLAEDARKKALEMANASVEVQEAITPARGNMKESNSGYDVSETYSIHIARRSLSAAREKRNKVKGKNLSAKYETFNILTSLLDMVDEDDKKNKNQ